MPRFLSLILVFFVLTMLAAVSEGSDAIVVCPRSWQPQLQPWIEQRAQAGVSATVVAPGSDAPATLAAIRNVATKTTRYVLLVGDAPAIGQATSPQHPVAIHYLPSRVTGAWGSTKSFPTDWTYGDFDQDGAIDAAVGRFPVHSADDLAAALKKQSCHEASKDFGLWRNHVELIGGIGGFGLLIDTAIESVSRAVVTSVLPKDVVTRVRYGSAGHRFYPTKMSFTDTVLEDYSRGARFWVYAGHGQVTQLDRVPPTAYGQPVLDRTTVTNLRCRNSHRPIAILLACFTGAIDAHQDCFAEQMWNQAGGPVAVLAGGRVTMPYGNATTAMEMIDAVYAKRVERLGDAWLQSLRQLESPLAPSDNKARVLVDSLATLISPASAQLSEERREHAKLYNLIGDPTLPLQHGEPIQLETQTGFDPGAPVAIRLQSPIDGNLTLTLAKPLGTPVEGDANELTIATKQSSISANESIVFSFVIDRELHGSVVCYAHVAGAQTWATGVVSTNVRRE